MAELGRYAADLAQDRVTQQVQSVGSIRSSASLMVAVVGFGGSVFASRLDCFGLLAVVATILTIAVVVIAVWSNMHVRVGLKFSVATMKVEEWRELDDNEAYMYLAEYINGLADANEELLAMRWRWIAVSGVLSILAVVLWAIASLG